MSPHAIITLSLAFHACLHAATVRFVEGTASAPVNTVLRDGLTFATSLKSKSEVSLSRGFFRVGSDTEVQVVTSNNLSLEKGIMLAGSDPARFRRTPVNVTAPGYKMELKGTAQIAYYPGHYVKITVLEGKVRVALQSLTGEWITLEPGQMLMINPSDKRLPEPVEVDINRLAATSQLIGGAFAELSTQGLIDAAAAAQGSAFAHGDLAQTPIRLSGASPEAGLALPNRQPPSNAILPAELTNFTLVNDLANPKATVVEKLYADGVSFSTFPSTSGLTTLTRTGAKTQKLTVSLTSAADDFGQYTGPAELSGTIRVDADVFGGSNRTLEFRSSEFGLTESEILTGSTDYALHLRSGTDIETPKGVSLNLIGDLGLTVEGSRLQAGTGKLISENLLLQANTRNISVTDSQLRAHDVTLSGSTRLPTETQQSITTDNAQITAQRNIKIGQAEKRTLISLTNSTQLSAIVGAITVQSKGGPISVDASALTAATTITLDSLNAASLTGSPVVITSATLSADIIRARGYSAAGDALIIDGSTFTAKSLIKLYGEGVSTLRFRNHVQLNTPLAIIAGKTVVVDPGGSVNITGQGRIHTDSAQFNTAGQGTINAGGGLSVQSFGTRPTF